MIKIAEQRRTSRTLVCSIIGGGGCGKSTLSALLDKPKEGMVSISVDDYVKGDRKHRRQNLESGDPRDKYDFQMMNNTLHKLVSDRSDNKTILIPKYDEKTGLGIDAPRMGYRKIEHPIEVIFVEGVFAGLVENPDIIIFLNTPKKLRLINRLKRATTKRKEGEAEEVKRNFEERELREFEPFALPYKEKAHYVIEVINKGEEYLYTLIKKD